MGWKEGQTLGATDSGLKEPVSKFIIIVIHISSSRICPQMYILICLLSKIVGWHYIWNNCHPQIWWMWLLHESYAKFIFKSDGNQKKWKWHATAM